MFLPILQWPSSSGYLVVRSIGDPISGIGGHFMQSAWFTSARIRLPGGRFSDMIEGAVGVPSHLVLTHRSEGPFSRTPRLENQ